MKASTQHSHHPHSTTTNLEATNLETTKTPEAKTHQRPQDNRSKPNLVVTVFSTLSIVLAGLCSTLIASNGLAETIAVPRSESSHSVPRPLRGTSKADVQSRFGEPLSKNGPRGNPSIYYWEYSDYTVYFEDNIVIHAVSKEKSLKPQ